MYVIVKMIKQPITGIELPIILLDSHDEIMEFETMEEAEKMKNLFEKNSDSGYRYLIKKI